MAQAFLKNPNTLRPSLIRRMPRFNLSDSENKELTDYIMTVYQTPAIDRDSMPASGYPTAQGRNRANSCSMRSMPASRATSSIQRPTRDTLGRR